jgi:hypothetical protein
LEGVAFPAEEIIGVLTESRSKDRKSLPSEEREGARLSSQSWNSSWQKDRKIDSRIAHTVHEGLRSVFGPELGVVERSSIPNDFNEE